MENEVLTTTIKEVFGFTPNINQAKEIQRLIFEVCRRDHLKNKEVINIIKQKTSIDKSHGRSNFFILKRALINLRFPLTSSKGKIDSKDVFLPQLSPPLTDNINRAKKFIPKKIFIEKGVKNTLLAQRFTTLFPKTEILELNHIAQYLQKHKFNIRDLKKPYVFIAREHRDFIKPCPCTKTDLGCNYWILNLGFGCPYDCSYCFLQQYTNFPGIILPANLDDFFENFNDFSKKIKLPIRIGSGEFCDSLALDHITGYTGQLISFLKDKDVLFELKTKSNNIANLSEQPSANIIISWSLNPQEIIRKEELGAASLQERLEAAQKVRNKGYPLAFHFDPIFHSKNWESIYKGLIAQLYQYLKPPFNWISLGTLRGTKKLKVISERRFPKSNIFYGELLIGYDKKLRYPKFLRQEIYDKMLCWIREYDLKTPVYLCMEDADCWQTIGAEFNSANKIEEYLVGTNSEVRYQKTDNK